MFVDTELRPQGEVQQKVGKIKLSEAIRRGCKTSRPSKEFASPIWIVMHEEECFACVAGAAWLGTGGGDEFFSSYLPKLCTRTGVTERILQDSINKYEREGQSREQVADWLAAQGL
jgi:hypothetical protein